MNLGGVAVISIHVTSLLVFAVFHLWLNSRSSIDNITEYESPTFDNRRGLIRIGSFAIFSLGGPMLFAVKGFNWLVVYYVALSVARIISASFVRWITNKSPAMGLRLFQLSPICIVASAAVPWSSNFLFEEFIIIMPMLNGVYIGGFWILLHDVNEFQGRNADDHQYTECASSIIGAVFAATTSIIFGIEISVAASGLVVLLGSMIPHNVDHRAFSKKLDLWNDEADVRQDNQVINAIVIVVAIAAMDWTALSTLRIDSLIGESIIDGVITLAVALAYAEAIGYTITRFFDVDVSNWGFKLIACILSLTGFSLMLIGPYWTPFGYLLTSTSGRVYFRLLDRKTARAGLRGIGKGVGTREFIRYSSFILCLPLLALHGLIPIIGILGVIFLYFTKSEYNKR